MKKTKQHLLATIKQRTKTTEAVNVILTTTSRKKSKHLKGQLDPRVSEVTFLHQRRSVGSPCQ